MENDPLADTESDLDLEEELTKHKLLKDAKCENGGIKKTILKPVELNSDVTILPSTKMVIIQCTHYIRIHCLLLFLSCN